MNKVIIIIVLGYALYCIMFSFIKFLVRKISQYKDKKAERNRPPTICNHCNNANKKEGASTAKEIRQFGKQQRNICEDCFRRYKFCHGCGYITAQSFSTYSGRQYCLNCFEDLNRSFSTTRIAALEYYGSKCAICGSTNKLQVHHKTYIREGRERLSDLVVLCKHHHVLQHTKVFTGPKGGKYIKRRGKKIYIKDGDSVYHLVEKDR